MMTPFFIFAGEASGDLHGSRLMQALKQRDSTCSFIGVGGPAMRKAGLSTLLNMEEFQVMGFTDVIKALPRLWKQFRFLSKSILECNPPAIILIDYPGFNLRLATSLRRKGYHGKIIQYIAPTVWAHGRERVETLARSVDLLLTIYPFENQYFADTTLQLEYIGNPLVEYIQGHLYNESWKHKLGIPENKPLIALFPGSRPSEIKQHLFLQLEAACRLKKEHPSLVFALSQIDPALETFMIDSILATSLRLGTDIYFVPKKYSYELMRDCYLAIAKSGTVTLELALHEKPTIVLYNLSSLNYWLAKYWLRVKLSHYCIVNILKEKQVYLELIDKKLSSAPIIQAVDKLYCDSKFYRSIKAECSTLKELLGTYPASQKAAEAIMEVLGCEVN